MSVERFVVGKAESHREAVDELCVCTSLRNRAAPSAREKATSFDALRRCRVLVQERADPVVLAAAALPQSDTSGGCPDLKHDWVVNRSSANRDIVLRRCRPLSSGPSSNRDCASGDQ